MSGPSDLEHSATKAPKPSCFAHPGVARTGGGIELTQRLRCPTILNGIRLTHATSYVAAVISFCGQKAGPTRPPVTSHVLDTGSGRPAQGVSVTLEFREPTGSWNQVTVRPCIVSSTQSLLFAIVGFLVSRSYPGAADWCG